MAKNRELEAQLTKKNQQYIFDLKKALELTGLPEEKKVLALNEMLPVLVEGQKTGQTARQLFGTVTERTDAIINEPEPARELTFKGMWLDNFSLLLGLLITITGVMPLLNNTKVLPGQGGLLTLLVGAASGAVAFYLVYKFTNVTGETKKTATIKSMLIMAGIILSWMLIFSTATILIPNSINPVMDPVMYIIVGAAILLARYLVRKKLNIKSSPFVR